MCGRYDLLSISAVDMGIKPALLHEQRCLLAGLCPLAPHIRAAPGAEMNALCRTSGCEG